MLSGVAVFNSHAYAGWEILPNRASSSGGQSEQVILKWVPEEEQGLPTFQAVLQKLDDDGRVGQIKHIYFVLRPSHEPFQTEILEQLEIIAPRELKEAMKSAGNMHNPKMTALRTSFEKAVLATPTVIQFKEHLARHDMEIRGLSFEKLFLFSAEGTKRFSCIMWLACGKSPTKAPPP